MRISTIMGSVLGTAVLALLVNGCSSNPKPKTVYNWTVKIQKTARASIQVDLVGINKTDQDLRTVRPRDYWSQGNKLREQVMAEGRAKTTTFESGSEFVLAKDDPIWAKWKREGAQDLLVMAELAFNEGDPPDKGRQIVPLDKKQWKGSLLEIIVSDEQVRVITPPK